MDFPGPSQDAQREAVAGSSRAGMENNYSANSAPASPSTSTSRNRMLLPVSSIHEECMKSYVQYRKEMCSFSEAVDLPLCRPTTAINVNYPCFRPTECPYFLLEGIGRSLRFLEWGDHVLRPYETSGIHEILKDMRRIKMEYQIKQDIFKAFMNFEDMHELEVEESTMFYDSCSSGGLKRPAESPIELHKIPKRLKQAFEEACLICSERHF